MDILTYTRRTGTKATFWRSHYQIRQSSTQSVGCLSGGCLYSYFWWSLTPKQWLDDVKCTRKIYELDLSS